MAGFSLRTIIIALTVALLSIPLYSVEHRVLRMGVYQNHPKLFLENQSPKGFFAEVSTHLGNELEVTFDYVPCDWSQCLNMLQTGAIDIMPDVAYTEDRSRRFKFGEVRVLESWSAIFAKSPTDIRSVFDLDNKTVAVLKQSFQLDYLTKWLPRHGVNARFILVDSFGEGFELVSKERVDCVVSNRFFGNLQTIDDSINMTSMVFDPADIYYAFSPTTSDSFIAEFDRQLSLIKANNQSIYYLAYKKWLTPPDRIHVSPWFWYLLVISSTIIVALLIAIVAFRFLLNRRTKDLQRQKEKYDYLAHHDPLTGLPNRLMFFEHMRQAIQRANEHKNEFALVYIDLDQFKQINDTLGHVIGDELLKAISFRLNSAVTHFGLLARLGGDEFAVIIESGMERDALIECTESIQTNIHKPIILNDQVFHLSSSLGISIFPQDGKTEAILIRNADTAMYQAKEQGRDAYQFYSAYMTDSITKRSEILKELRKAINDRSLYMVYQPQFNLRTGELVGLESLVRWEHTEKGFISPLVFISVAEDFGLIIELGEQILTMVCLQVSEWVAQEKKIGKVSVNISAKQLQDDEFLNTVKRVLAQTNCDPKFLEFEITESYFIQDVKNSSEVLNQIRALGIEIAIDDFGTGYSSLSYLKWIPANRLKIDQSFVRDLNTDENNRAIVAAIISFSHATNLTVIAEGIETESQKQQLLEMNCQQGQGYFLGRPVTPTLLQCF